MANNIMNIMSVSFNSQDLQRNFSPAQEGKTYCIRYGWCLQGSCGSSLQAGTRER